MIVSAVPEVEPIGEHQSGGVANCKVSWMTLHFSRRSDCVVADSDGLAFTCTQSAMHGQQRWLKACLT